MSYSLNKRTYLFDTSHIFYSSCEQLVVQHYNQNMYYEWSMKCFTKSKISKHRYHIFQLKAIVNCDAKNIHKLPFYKFITMLCWISKVYIVLEWLVVISFSHNYIINMCTFIYIKTKVQNNAHRFRDFIQLWWLKCV